MFPYPSNGPAEQPAASECEPAACSSWMLAGCTLIATLVRLSQEPVELIWLHPLDHSLDFAIEPAIVRLLSLLCLPPVLLEESSDLRLELVLSLGHALHANPANGRYQPRPESVGCMPWLDDDVSASPNCIDSGRHPSQVDQLTPRGLGDPRETPCLERINGGHNCKHERHKLCAEPGGGP